MAELILSIELEETLKWKCYQKIQKEKYSLASGCTVSLCGDATGNFICYPISGPAVALRIVCLRRRPQAEEALLVQLGPLCAQECGELVLDSLVREHPGGEEKWTSEASLEDPFSLCPWHSERRSARRSGGAVSFLLCFDGGASKFWWQYLRRWPNLAVSISFSGLTPLQLAVPWRKIHRVECFVQMLNPRSELRRSLVGASSTEIL